MSWEPPALDISEDTVTERILAGLATRMPGWTPVEGAPEVAIAEEVGREIAELNLATVEGVAFAAAAIGETVFGFAADEGRAATINVTLTLTQAPTVVLAGFTVVGVNDVGEEVAFQLAGDTAAMTTTPTLTMTAVDVGQNSNGVPTGALIVMTPTTEVVDATAVSASSGGSDPETLETYLDRLTDWISVLRPGGVVGEDLAALARTVPGVARALGVDLYDPGDPGNPTDRTCTIFCVDQYGMPVAGGVKADVVAVAEVAREVNFNIFVEDPTYTQVVIAFVIVPDVGADPSLAVAEAELAVTRWLTEWGTRGDDPRSWESRNTVRLFDLARVIGAAAGVAYVDAITINGNPTDLVMTGPAAYPTPVTALVSPSSVTGSAT